MKGCTQREKHAPRGLSVGNFLKAFTLVYFAISFGLSLWVGTSFEASAVLNVLVPVAGLCGLALLAANLLFGLFSKRKRGHYLLLAACVILCWTFDWTAVGWHVDKRRRKFMESGRLAYESTIQGVLSNQSTLTDGVRNAGSLRPTVPPPEVHTNTDGSLTILFPGGEGGPRHGYLYHSGGPQALSNWQSEGLVHLTNGWYEY